MVLKTVPAQAFDKGFDKGRSSSRDRAEQCLCPCSCASAREKQNKTPPASQKIQLTDITAWKSGPELAGSPVAGFSSCCLEAAPPRFQNLLSDVTPTPAALPSCCAASWGRGNFQTQCVNTQRGHRPEVRRQAASSRAEGSQGPAVPHRGCTAAILGPSKDRVALVVLLVSSVRVTLEKKHYHSPFHSPWIAITK
ncbi:hypothetical protein Anapl_01053 [Anas platyrhynchos]|uniref:Uncharacterized protein n=1 Tax=Anas platyrhynchos TaxID=8839 RepID=R0LLZ9_ANAPL|nr:hypothetical protein Anapl_01053 [Anas platyrhynchos]